MAADYSPLPTQWLDRNDVYSFQDLVLHLAVVLHNKFQKQGAEHHCCSFHQARLRVCIKAIAFGRSAIASMDPEWVKIQPNHAEAAAYI